MDFTLDTEQKALRDAVRDLAQRNAPQQHGEGDVQVGPRPLDPALWSALAEVGALGLPFPETVGGFGATAVEVGLVATELGRAGVVVPYAEAMTAGSLLAAAGRDELLGALAEGSSVVLPALNEPGRAWSLTSSQVKASGSGQDWSLTGTKGPIIGAAQASHLVVSAQTDDGLALFLLDAASLDDDTISLQDTAAELLLDAAATPAALAAAVNLGTATLSAEALGAMEAALDLTTEYLKTRKQFGVPLMTFQTLTQRAADMYTSLEMARSAAQFGAMTVAESPADSAMISRVKVVTGQSGRHIGQEAIQLHGGIGVTAEYAVAHFTARLTAIEHTFGDTRQHLASLAAGVGSYEDVDILA